MRNRFLLFLLGIGCYLLILVYTSNIIYEEPTIFLKRDLNMSIEQIHIGLGPLLNSMSIMWVSKTEPQECWVELENSIYNKPTKANMKYNSRENKIVSRYMFNQTIFNLTPHKLYSYQIHCLYTPISVSSEVHTFQGPPSLQEPVHALIFADFQTNGFADIKDNYSPRNKPNILPELTRRTLNKEKIDLLIHAGDLGYDLDSFQGKMGDRFMNKIQPIASKISYMTVPGNHESNTNFTHYASLFPSWEEGLYYSFNIGEAHFLMMDSESFVGRFHTSLHFERHLNWIKKDLESNTQPWTIVVSHRPIYCRPHPPCRICTSACTFYSQTLSPALEDLFNTYNVTLYISGDVHLYERTLPLYKNTTTENFSDFHYFENPKNPIYIVNGVAGNFDRDEKISTIGAPMSWSASITDKLGFGSLSIYNKTHLHYQQFTVGSQNDFPKTLENVTEELFDEFWIVKHN